MKISIDVKTGELTSDESYVAPPMPPVYATYEDASAAMIRWIDGLTMQVEGRYPSSVKAGWADEEAMARAHLAGTATQAQTDILTVDAASRGRTPTEQANAIIGNADAFRAVLGEVRKLWLATDTALQAVTDPYGYEQVLDSAKAQAAPLAAAHGLTVA